MPILEQGKIDSIQRKHQEKSPPSHNISFIVKTYRMSNTGDDEEGDEYLDVGKIGQLLFEMLMF